MSQPQVALCYIRQSFTRDEDDKASPERQRSYIEAKVKAEGWTPEWYEDADGHKSGRFVKNRPGWLSLEARIGDPDVVAIIAYDLARLHRKGWRIGDLLDQITRHNIRLVFAAPGYEMDLSSFNGRMLAQISAMLDEAYAEDVSRRTKASIAYLRDQGKSVGRPPFGTIRNQEGYIEPSDEGAWVLPDGLFDTASPDKPPHADAQWRCYFDCAKYILTLYAHEGMGADTIAYRLNLEHWPFRDRKGHPRPVTRDDVRRVLANWPDYGGAVPEKKAKDRPAYDDDVDKIRFRKERAVFDLDLLRAVGQRRKSRSRKPVDSGVNRRARAYPLSGLIYCAHCEKLAKEQDDPRLRTRFTGTTNKKGVRRYKHKTGVKCGCHNRTVPTEQVEEDFEKLIKLLTIREEAVNYMTELAVQAERDIAKPEESRDLEKEKSEAIALCQRRIDAAVHLYGEGRINREEYLRRMEKNEREMMHWEARTTETERVALELATCIEAVNQMHRVWETASDEEKKDLAQHLFTGLLYNIDTRRFESFSLKPWADRFLIIRMDLYYQMFGELEGEKENSTPVLGEWNPVPHRGLEPLFWP